ADLYFIRRPVSGAWQVIFSFRHSVSGNRQSGIRMRVGMPVQQVAGSDGNSYFFRRQEGQM
uniref:Uncharacterized protein n=1 Tax=Romanomermis culicivorax TaxID=13658 RepID=A0A915JQ47_ROMCU